MFWEDNCPSCHTIQTDGAGYPHLGLKGLGAYRPLDECDRWPGDYAVAKGFCGILKLELLTKVTGKVQLID